MDPTRDEATREEAVSYRTVPQPGPTTDSGSCECGPLQPAMEVVEISTGAVVHIVECPGEIPGTRAWDRIRNGILNNVGRFDCRLSRGGHDEADDRLDLDRFFVRDSGAAP